MQTSPDLSLPRGTRLELSEAVFQLLIMLWTYPSQDGVMDASTTVHFTAVIGIHRSGLVCRDAYNFNPDLEALIWDVFYFLNIVYRDKATKRHPWRARCTHSS